MSIEQGWLSYARRVPSDFFNLRPKDGEVSLLVVHNISLPPAMFGGNYIDQLFTGTLRPEDHPFFQQIYKLEVSAHCLIRRDGEVVQYVSFDKRAWHAGVSSFQGRTNCNDFSIGIEMEGTDTAPYSQAQYDALNKITQQLLTQYPLITLGRIVGHNDIAPGRKTDPGISFDWAKYRLKLRQNR